MRAFISIAIVLLAGTAAADARKLVATSLPALPQPVANNAVASVSAHGGSFLVSFAGLGTGKTHADTHARTWIYDQAGGHWREADPVPGGVGRLAAAAATAGDLVYVFGGYTVAADGAEVSTPFVHAFDPVAGTFEARAPMAVPVDDAVAVTFKDRYIYLVSGWHDLGNVNLVQRYDTMQDRWDQATPTPGPAVFGHAGGIVDDRIVYCDGVAIAPRADARREFVLVDDCLQGTIDAEDGRRIDWRVLPPHPGAPRYRMAAAGIEGGVLFIGGSENPYNYDGIGYDGEPSHPAPGALFHDLGSGGWQLLKTSAAATMDHRGLAPFAGGWATVGGMAEGQRVSAEVRRYELD